MRIHRLLVAGLGLWTACSPPPPVRPSRGAEAPPPGTASAAHSALQAGTSASALPSATASASASARSADTPPADDWPIPLALRQEAYFIFVRGDDRIDVDLSLRTRTDFRATVKTEHDERRFKQISFGPALLAGQPGESLRYQRCIGCPAQIWERAASDTVMVTVQRAKKHDDPLDGIVSSLSREPRPPVMPGVRRLRALGLSFEVPLGFDLSGVTFTGPGGAAAQIARLEHWTPCADETFKAWTGAGPKAGMTFEHQSRRESVIDGVPVTTLSCDWHGPPGAGRDWFLQTGPLGTRGACTEIRLSGIDEAQVHRAEDPAIEPPALATLTVVVARAMWPAEAAALSASSTASSR
jgi:hypothetical protein